MNDDKNNPATAITVPKRFPWLWEIEVAALFATGDCLAGVVLVEGVLVVDGVPGAGLEVEGVAGGLLGLLAAAP